MFIARVLAEAGFDVDGGDVNAEISHDLETGVSYFLYLLKQIMPEEPKGKKDAGGSKGRGRKQHVGMVTPQMFVCAIEWGDTAYRVLPDDDAGIRVFI